MIGHCHHDEEASSGERPEEANRNFSCRRIDFAGRAAHMTGVASALPEESRLIEARDSPARTRAGLHLQSLSSRQPLSRGSSRRAFARAAPCAEPAGHGLIASVERHEPCPTSPTSASPPRSRRRSPPKATKPRRRSRPRPSRTCWPAATSAASPRPAPARPRPSRCRSCTISPSMRARRRGAAAAPWCSARRASSRARSPRASAPTAGTSGCRPRWCSAASPIGKQERTLARGVDILVATPGRLLDLIDRRSLSLARRRGLRPRRGRPHARHGLHPRPAADREAAAGRAADAVLLGDDAGDDRRRSPRRS